MSERGFHGDGLSFGIQGLFSYSKGSLFILYPEGNQAPGKELNLGMILIGNHRVPGIRECGDMKNSFKHGIEKGRIEPPFDGFAIFT
jgi:hypothetical protein